MPRHITALVIALSAGATVGLRAQDDPVVASRAAYARAAGAYEAHDTAGFLRFAREAERLRPAHGGAVYALAAAHALAGHDAEALAALRRFAALGYVADVAADSDFVSLRGRPAFAEIRRAIDRNAAPLAPGRPAFTLPDRDLLTEGIAYDPGARSFFIGSVRHRKIFRINEQGRASEFIAPGRDGLWAPLGMRVDSVRKVLWVASAAVPQMSGYQPADSLRSGLFRFDLSTGALTGRFEVPADRRPHVLGDLTISRAGDVYASDSRGPVIYRVRAGVDTLERFTESPLLLSAQGLALDPDERTLYVADYARGVLRVDLASRRVRLVPTDTSVLTLGIDGLYVAGRALIAIQNGVSPARVARLTLDPAGDRILRGDVLERARPDYAEPTLGVIVGDELFYVANSQWERFRDDGEIDAPERLQPPLVLRLRL
jgi:sugar lactone lactonase YvrE